MSKKTFKRSLALGALMTFVITGSAMAMEPVNAPNVGLGNVNNDWVEHYVDGKLMEDDVTVTAGSNAVYICGGGVKTEVPDMHIEAKTISLTSNTTTGGAVILNSGDGSYGYLDIDFSDSMTLMGNVENGKAHGISNASENGVIDIDGNGIFTLTAAESGVYARADGAKIDINAKTITIESLGEDEGELEDSFRGHAVVAKSKNTNVNLEATDKLTVTSVAGKNAVLASGDGSNITVDGGKETAINGKIYAMGRVPYYNNNKGELAYKDEDGSIEINVYGEKITIDANGDRAVQASSDYYGGDSTVINIGDSGTDKVDIKNTSYGLYSQYYGSEVNVKAKELVINSDSVGIYAGNNKEGYNDETKENVAVVNIESQNAKITVNGGNNYGIWALSHGVVNVVNGLDLEADKAILVRGGSDVNVNTSGNGVVQIDGDIMFHNQNNSSDNFNEHIAASTASVDINMTTADSYLEGSVYVENSSNVKDENKQTGADVSGMKLGLSKGATWTVTGDSFVSEMYGTDGNVVLKYEDATDDGVDVAQVDIGKNSNENLTVSGDEALTKAIEDGIVDATAALNALNDAVTTTDESSKEVAVVKTAEGKILGSYVLNADGTATLQESSKSAAVSEAGMNLKAHWRAHMNDMNKRMGELHFANGEAGVWTRMVRGESEYEGAKMQYNQYQLGYDEKLSVDKRWTVGAAVTFSEGDSNYSTGSSEDKSTAFAIYGSKLNNDGTFVDLIARYARLESDIEDCNYEKGEYDTNGMSVSAEFGKRIQQGNGLWIEPQVELTYGTVDSASVRFADGSVANYGDMDSFIGRVGFSLGKDIKQGNVYARASYLYDFDGETETTFTNGVKSGKPVEEDFGGGWWEVGVGANINLSKATYIYADIEKTFGGEVDTNWQWNLGVRYSF